LFQVVGNRFISFLIDRAFISTEDSGTGFGEEPGIILLIWGDPGELFQHLQHLFRQFLLIISLVYPQDIIVFPLVIFTGTGEVGAPVIGIDMVGIAITVAIDGRIMGDQDMTVIVITLVGGIDLDLTLGLDLTEFMDLGRIEGLDLDQPEFMDLGRIEGLDLDQPKFMDLGHIEDLDLDQPKFMDLDHVEGLDQPKFMDLDHVEGLDLPKFMDLDHVEDLIKVVRMCMAINDKLLIL
jgi:hypothetical protein